MYTVIQHADNEGAGIVIEPTTKDGKQIAITPVTNGVWLAINESTQMWTNQHPVNPLQLARIYVDTDTGDEDSIALVFIWASGDESMEDYTHRIKLEPMGEPE